MLSKIKIPFHLLSTTLKGSSLDLDCYLTESTHSIQVAASAAVQSKGIRVSTRKKGWSVEPELELAKNCHKFWFKKRILKSTKKEFRKAVLLFKRRQVYILSRNVQNHPQLLWSCGWSYQCSLHRLLTLLTSSTTF